MPQEEAEEEEEMGVTERSPQTGPGRRCSCSWRGGSEAGSEAASEGGGRGSAQGWVY